MVALRARVTGPLLLADALRVVADCAELEQLSAIALEPANVKRRRAAIAGTLAAAARVAQADATGHRPSDQAVAALSRAEAQFASLAGTACIQVDYAAQFESERARTATCARMERHNFEVCHVGFSPYVQAAREGRFRNKRPRERFVYKQQVYVFFAFSNAGYKPNARSHNIVQEDIAHFLKYGTFLHGEWFEGGERYPGGPTGDARQPLPCALSTS